MSLRSLAALTALGVGLIATDAVPALAQDPTVTNSVGMQLVLIQPGKFQVGVFTPTCPDPNARPGAGGGGFGGAGGAAGQGASAALGAGGQGPAAALGAGGQGAAAANPGGAQPAQARPPRPPADPRTRWTPEDYAKCELLLKQDTMPGFSVEIKKPYYIGKFEVTQAQWKKVMGANPSVFQGDKVPDDADQHPVDSVTWQDAQAFVKKLNAMEKTTAYRLPTEFEWEYAGRAGGPGQLTWPDIRKQAWSNVGASAPYPHTVGTKEPNAWGLYDMLGNVWEWVSDYYNYKIFPDPIPPKNGTLHVLKGGAFSADVKNVIYSTHGAGPADGWDVGFRVVKDVIPAK
jgi:sulfatase modifying factor 1